MSALWRDIASSVRTARSLSLIPQRVPCADGRDRHPTAGRTRLRRVRPYNALTRQTWQATCRMGLGSAAHDGRGHCFGRRCAQSVQVRAAAAR